MAFIKKMFLLLKIFEKVEKTGIISTKFSFRCTPSVILGVQWYSLQDFDRLSSYPYLNKGGRLCPRYYYWPLYPPPP